MTTTMVGNVQVSRRQDVVPGRSGLRQRVVDPLLYFTLVLMPLGAWRVSELGLFTAESDVGYWIGVAGGVCMLALFTYPMRKHLRFMQRFGAGKSWFAAHMVLGVVGPMLILLHSTFRIGSINAGVALFSMVLVAASGVVGRFLYVRVHRNLHGEKVNLNELRGVHAASDAPAHRLRFAPEVAERLCGFERYALQGVGNRPALLHALVKVPLRRWQVAHASRRVLKIKLLAAAHGEGWSRRNALRMLRKARRLVNAELMSVQRIAQFHAWERLFALWHVVHVPFVYLMVLSAVAHVVAVHAY